MEAKEVLSTSDSYASRLIQHKALQLCRQSGFRRSDEDDIAQELSLLVLRKLNQFDATRACVNTFVDRVVASGARMLLRKACRRKRRLERNVQSLDAHRPGTECPLRNLVEQDAHARRRGRMKSDATQSFIDRDAIEQALASLPDELRSISERLKASSQNSLAADLGISRRQLRKSIALVRQRFVHAGFEETRNRGQRGAEGHK
jgi:RNA polymerase sigma factor (sigma-70 family)